MTGLRRLRGRAPAPHERNAGVFAVWILLMWVPLTLLGGVLDPARPKLRLQLLRYWYPVFPAFVLGGGIPDRAAQMAPMVPMRRAGSADEVAQAIVWLLSDASSYTTGSIVDVAGGR